MKSGLRISLTHTAVCLAAVLSHNGWAAPPAAPDASTLIVARGRIEPVGRVHLVSGPSTGGRVAELRVTEGERVPAGSILATLDTQEREAASAAAADRDLRLAILQRAQVAAGAKSSELVAQRAMIAARRAELERVTRQFERSRALMKENFISGEALDLQQLETRRAQENLQQATATLAALTEVRAVDLQVADGRIEQARARLAQARAQLALTEIRAPITGTVLAIYGRAGSALTQDGLLRMGDLSRLIVVAEVNEFEAPRLTQGQPAAVSIRGLSQALRGRVTRVLGLVAVNERPTTDVLRGRDARVVETEIAMDAGQTLPPFVGTEVTVSIDTRSAPAR